jgi:hypothetical protein
MQDGLSPLPLKPRSDVLGKEAFCLVTKIEAGNPEPQDLPGLDLQPRCDLLQREDFIARFSGLVSRHVAELAPLTSHETSSATGRAPP